jgi:hypothetical protein
MAHEPQTSSDRPHDQGDDPDVLLTCALRQAAAILAERDDRIRRDDDDAVELAEAFTGLDRRLSAGGAMPRDWRSHVLAEVTVHDVEQIAGRRLTQAERTRIATAVGHSTIPESFTDIIFAITES